MNGRPPPVAGAPAGQDPSAARFAVMAAVVAALLIVLGGRLAWVQLVSSAGYREVATGNRIRIIETPAPRGRILDVNGRVLAGSRESLTVTLDWEPLVELDAADRFGVFLQVADELTMSGHRTDADDLARTFDRARRQALRPVVLAEDVDPELWISLTERNLPGFSVAPVPIRTYPFGVSAAHLLGYVGTVVDETEAVALNRAAPGDGYRAGTEIGRAGLERIFERRLRGTPEVRRVEVDSRNRVVRTVEITQAARPGQDLHLTLDVDLQVAAEEALAEQLAAVSEDPETPAPAGSFVVLDPRDGAVLAMVSLPSFDPSSFVLGLGGAEADRLFTDQTRPFLNRAINGLYPAGSTFKPIPAYAALTSGARSQFEVWDDRGTYRLSGCRGVDGTKGCVFRNAKGLVMGPVDLREALTRSSDTYFYSLGEKFWVERDRYGEDIIQQTAARFGLGQPSGVELPSEAAGRLPSPTTRQADHDQYPNAFPDPRWYTGDNVNLAIGQGDLLVTPLQLANMYGTLATGGTRYQPRLVERLEDGGTGETLLVFEPRLVTDERLDAQSTTAIIEGLLDVPVDGTAAQAFAGFDHGSFPLAAKTGTAEVNNKADNSLFAGFGPWPEPTYAFAVIIEEGGFGGVAAAPVARAFFDRVLGVEDPPPLTAGAGR